MSDAVLRFVGTDSGLSAQFARANASLKQLETNSNKTTQLLTKGFATAAGVIGAISFVRLAQEAFEFAEQLQIASARTGIQIEALQKLQFVAGQSETSFDAITASINKFQVNIATGNEKSIAALQRLGISISDIAAANPDQQFLKIAESVARIEDPATRAKVAVDLFGKGGTALLPLLRKGAEGVEELNRQFNELGGAVSEETIGKVDDLGDAFARLGSQSKSLVTELVALAQPLVSPILEGVSDLLTDARIILGQADELSVLAENIKFLKEQQGGLGVVALGESNFNPEGGLSFLTNGDITGALANLQRQRDAIIALNKAPPLQDIALTPDMLRIPQLVSDQKSPDELRREETEISRENPVIVRALEEKDLTLQINQEKLDELTRQQGEFVDRMKVSDSELAQFRAATREQFGLEEITFETAKSQTILGLATSIFGTLARENSKIARIQQALAIATTIWDTSRAVMKAFAELPYPANIGVAAFAAAQGAIQIAKIKSTNYTGGGGGGGSVAQVSAGGSAAGRESGTAPSSGASDGARLGVTQKPQTTVNVFGWSESAIRDLVRRIKEEVGDHDLNIVRNS